MKLSIRDSAVWGRRSLSVLLAISISSAVVRPTSAYNFEGYVKWANKAFQGGPSNPSCRTSATDFLDFVYAVVYGTPATVGTPQLTQACLNCSQALDSVLALMPSSQPSVCSLLQDPVLANRTAVSLRRFVCLGTSAGAAGSCVVRIVSALKSADLLERVRLQDPTLSFSGPVLQRLCSALAPPPPAQGSCCTRTWAYLMAALAQQSCLPALAQEYLSLAGRCEALSNTTVPGFCEASWAQDLLPLLFPPAVCSLPSAPAVVPAWANGTACSTDQLDQLRPAKTSCDLWCGLVGDVERALDRELPPTPVPGGNNGTTNGDGGKGDDGGDDDGLQTATVVVVCIFGSLIFLLLVGFVVFGVKVYRENKVISRAHYEFESNFPVGVPPSPGPPAPRPSSKPPSAPSTPRVPPPADPAVAAAAGDLTQTPRYEPGPPPPPVGTSSSGAAAAAEAAAREYGRQRSSSSMPPQRTASGAVGRVGSSPGLARASGGTTVARALVYDRDVGGSSMNSRSSKYESAASIFPKSWGAPSGPVSGIGSGRMSPAGAHAGAFATVAGSGTGALAAGDKLRAHRLSLSDSDTIYQTAQSPMLEGYLTGNSGGAASPSSALLGAATPVSAAAASAGAGAGVGMAAGPGSLAASGGSGSIGSNGSTERALASAAAAGAGSGGSSVMPAAATVGPVPKGPVAEATLETVLE